MCDTIVIVANGVVRFAKNSDRDANEAQLLDWQPAADHPEGADVRCTYLTIPQVRHTHAVLLSRPFWMWGAEMGANEHGVVIGNEAVFTRRPTSKTGLTGMDLLRLALERAETAEQAVEVLTSLLAAHGQGGGCDLETRKLTYHNSYLVADPTGAFVLETADRETAIERVEGVRSISNLLTIEPFARAHSDWLFTKVAAGGVRCARTAAQLTPDSGVADLMAVLRDHGEGRTAPRYHRLNGTLGTVCMHGGGMVASSVSTASWVSELRPEGVQHWATGTSGTCTGLFKPVRVDQPMDPGTAASDVADAESLWWRHERLHRQVLSDPARLLPLYAAERDALEARWLADPPESAGAFAEGDRLLAQWTARVSEAVGRDLRPRWVRRWWRKRDRSSQIW